MTDVTPRAYVFDAYGTLFDVHAAIARHRAPRSKRAGSPPPPSPTAHHACSAPPSRLPAWPGCSTPLRPEQVVFVSSNRWDVMGAAAFGFRPLWVNRAQMPEEYSEHAPLRVVPDLSGLLSLDL